MADTLTLKEVELDYEADEGDEGRGETPTPRGGTSSPRPDSQAEGEVLSSPAAVKEEEEEKEEEEGEGEVESGEELEDGEISDEDETLRNERNEPKPVCRFFNKGQCTWGSSCRFLHPGVLDKGNYSMFAAPRPILPGEPDEPDEEQVAKEPILIRPPPPAYETAWERGLRQAKEMRRRSHKRREMDVEYEEKKASLSLTQIELDKENDYYMRPASPAHTHDPYAEDDPYLEAGGGGTSSSVAAASSFHPVPEVRRVAPPPPSEFQARQEREASRRYSESPPPRVRRIAPPRSLSPRGAEDGGGGVRQPYRRTGEDWADPWMRSKEEKPRVGRATRRQSYSSGSSRSSSSRSSLGSRSPRRRRRYSSSYSKSSSRSSRSRSSTPEGIPIRSRPPAAPRSTAPLQKRLAAISQQKPGTGRLKTEGARGAAPVKQEGQRPPSPGGSRPKAGQGKEQSKTAQKEPKQKEPVKFALPKNQIKLTLKTATGKPVNATVLEKLGTSNDDLEAGKRKRKLDLLDNTPEAQKMRKLENQELMEILKQRLKTKLEDKQAAEAGKDAERQRRLQEVIANEKKSKEMAAAAAAAVAAAAAAEKAKEKKKKASGDAKTRREELLKQLKAVEEAITRKRTKLEK